MSHLLPCLVQLESLFTTHWEMRRSSQQNFADISEDVNVDVIDRLQAPIIVFILLFLQMAVKLLCLGECWCFIVSLTMIFILWHISWLLFGEGAFATLFVKQFREISNYDPQNLQCFLMNVMTGNAVLSNIKLHF